MSKLTDLPNVGPKLAAALEGVGICTPEQLQERDAQEVFCLVRAQDPTACLHKLYAIAAAIQGVPKPCLTPEVKGQLRDFFNQLPK